MRSVARSTQFGKTTKAKLQEQFTALDPVRMLQEIRTAQNTLTILATTGAHDHVRRQRQ